MPRHIMPCVAFAVSCVVLPSPSCPATILVCDDALSSLCSLRPGHDPNDYELGQRFSLPIINIMNDDGTLNDNAGAC